MKKLLIIITSILVIIGGGIFILKQEDSSNEKKTITISVASSLYEPMNKIKSLYEKSNPNIKLDINFGASSSLEKQITQGAPVDLFISASAKYTDQLINNKIVKKENVCNILGNKLVLVENKSVKDKLNSIEELVHSTGKIAIGDKSVPVGDYAIEAFNNLGILNSISDRIIYGKDAVSVLNYLEKGEVDYGVIYENELIGSKNITKVADFPENSHSPIIYTLATISNDNLSNDFKNFLLSEKGKAIFKDYGFEVDNL